MNPLPSRPYRLGIVGGIASGKSLVTNQLEHLGAKVIDADKIAHQTLANPDIAVELQRLFGNSVFHADGTVHRKMLGKLVFGVSPEAISNRIALENLLHPSIRKITEKEMFDAVGSNRFPLIVLDAPLLLEAHWENLCDGILYIETSDEKRWKRARERGWTKEDWTTREAAQWPLPQKKEAATFIIQNSGTIEKLEESVEQLFRQITCEKSSQ